MSEQTNNYQIEIEKIDLIRIVNDMWKGVKRFWFLMLLLMAVLGGIYAFRSYRNYTPVYSVNATFTITSNVSSLYNTTNHLNNKTASQLVNTFPYILKSGIFQKKIAQELGTESIPGVITSEPLGSTNMITIIVTSGTPQYAYDILQAVIEHYPEIAEPVIGEVSMNLLDMTDVPDSPSNPFSYKRDLLDGALVGMWISLALLLVYAFTRNTIHEEEDFKKMLNIDCICAIPQIIFKRRSKKHQRNDISIYNKKISQTFLEAVRVLRARIEKDAKRNGLQVFLVTSAAPGEGKSTIAANIAMALAMRESKVVLVDCDLRNPSVRERLNIEKEGVGLYEYLVKKAELKDILIWNDTYQMYVIPGGQAISNASELIDSPRMHKLLNELKGLAEYVILDTAPVGILTDTAVLAEAADAALFVVKQDYVNRAAIMEGIGQLAESKIYISGCILNGAQAGIGGYGYKNYRYYSKYGNYRAGSHYKNTEKESLQ